MRSVMCTERISQFLSSNANLRTDSYGDSVTNRIAGVLAAAVRHDALVARVIVLPGVAGAVPAKE